MKETRARRPLLAGTSLEVGPADAVEKQCVACERGGVVEQVGRALLCVTRGMHGNQGHRAEDDPVAVGHRSKGIQSAVLGWQQERGALEVSQPPRSRKMVSMDVGIHHRYRPPAAITKQSDVDARIDRGVDNDRLGLRFHDVGEASLSSSPDLHDLAAGDHCFGGIPSERPSAHAAVERQCFDAIRSEQVGSDCCGPANSTDGDDGSRRQV